jgi:hypothetical protein
MRVGQRGSGTEGWKSNEEFGVGKKENPQLRAVPEITAISGSALNLAARATPGPKRAARQKSWFESLKQV